MKRLVTDASTIVEVLLGTPRGRRAYPSVSSPEVDLHVPSLCDVEVTSALRGLVRRGRLEAQRARDALQDYRDLPVTRHGHLMLLDRMFELRDNFSSYDAAYVVLAEALDAALHTEDERLTRALRAHTEVQQDR